ncbi:MAG TPA: hypothetical protein ENJ79_02165 [Gammaproteobacteria bacterium]|nr:hypothetical protein [Gammaproteobacteria bacterium]
MGKAALLSARGSRCARDEYELGITFFRKKQWRNAARHFAQAALDSRPDDPARERYRAWQGLALVYAGDLSGLNLCRHAAAAERMDATVYQNLALAELKLRHRKRAVEAVQKGLALDPGHRGLCKLRRNMGARRRPCLIFLDRNNPINKWLGKLTWKQQHKRGKRKRR